jgi:hypothetical protein
LYLPRRCTGANFILLKILTIGVFLGFSSNIHLITTHYVYAVPSTDVTTTKSSRFSGPVTSLQFSTDGNASWIVSGRWKMDLYFDNAAIVPLSVRNFNMTLVMVSADGSISQRYKLSDLKQSIISYENKTKTSTIRGTVTIAPEGEPTDNVGGVLKIINKKVLTVSLDPLKMKDRFGGTPIYGLKR